MVHRNRTVAILALCTLVLVACGQVPVEQSSGKKQSFFGTLIEEAASRSGVNSVQESPVPFAQPGKSAILPSAKWIPQSFNNCAPATTAMILQYFGHTVSQVETKSALRTSSDDKNVFTPEIQTYLKNNFGLESKLGFGGDLQLLKTLFANGFYVMVEDWLHPNEDIGHNTIIRGYDDDRQVVISDDSFIGVGVTFPYDVFMNNQWKAFNHEYLVVYTKDQEPLLKAILGSRWDDTAMWQHAVEVNRQEVQTNAQDMYAWFNLGSSYFGQGNYAQAQEAYEHARTLGWPRRMLWYQIQPIQTYNKLGQYQKALDLIQEGLSGNQEFAELHYEAAVAYRGLGKVDAAAAEMEKVRQYNPKFSN